MGYLYTAITRGLIAGEHVNGVRMPENQQRCVAGFHPAELLQVCTIGYQKSEMFEAYKD